MPNPELQKEEEIEQRKSEKELFEMVYNWGKAGIKTDELCNAFQDKLKEVLATYGNTRAKMERGLTIDWINDNISSNETTKNEILSYLQRDKD